MKTITYYICEICGTRYNNEEIAVMCEAKGNPKHFPRGMIFGNHSRGAFYKDITFAVAYNHNDGHQNAGALWACRNNSAGDSLAISDVCGGHSIEPDTRDVPDKNHPTFARMLKLLRSFGFAKSEITVWNGIKPITLKEFQS